MLFNKKCDVSPMMGAMPRNDIFADIDINQKYIKNEGVMPNKGGNCCCNNKMMEHPMMEMGGCGCKMQPVYEQPIEKCVHRTICHEVPHVCPINTKIINHHVYKHTYSPCYSCCEENEVCQINEGSCCCFK